MNKKYVLNKAKDAIRDINVSEFTDNFIVFPAEVDEHPIKSIYISNKSLKELNDKFGHDGYTVFISDGIKNIKDGMFEDSYITSIVIPPSITEIPKSCFKASSLEEVTFQVNSNLKVIGASAFENCGYLKSIKFPKTLREIRPNAFRSSRIEDVKLPEEMESLSIGNSAFMDCSYLIDITFPKAKIRFEKNAFTRCWSLWSVDMSKADVEFLSYAMFANCSSLDNIKLPKTLKSIGCRAFYSCYSIQTVNLIDTQVEEICDNAFDSCHQYEDGRFPDTLKTIGMDAFCDCGLKGLALPPSLNKIGENSFSSNPLKTVDLTPLTLCDEIGDNIFSDCGITKVSIPIFRGSSVTAIHMFDSCEDLEEVVVEENAELYEGMFNHCTKLRKVTLPKTLKTIPEACFRKSSNLKHIDFPKSLRSIGSCAFSNSGLEDLDLEDSDIVLIGPGAFKCVALNSIQLPVYNCEVSNSAFDKKDLDTIKETSPFVRIVK